MPGKLLRAHFYFFQPECACEEGVTEMEGLQLDYRIPFPCFFSPNWKQLPAVALLQTLLLGADSASRWEALTSQKRQLRAGLSSQPSLPAPGSSWSCTTPWKSTVSSLLPPRCWGNALCDAPSFCFLHKLCWGELGEAARTS